MSDINHFYYRSIARTFLYFGIPSTMKDKKITKVISKNDIFNQEMPSKYLKSLSYYISESLLTELLWKCEISL